MKTIAPIPMWLVYRQLGFTEDFCRVSTELYKRLGLTHIRIENDYFPLESPK